MSTYSRLIEVKMIAVQNVPPAAIAALTIEFAPAVAFAFAAERITRAIQRWPMAARIVFPALHVLPYVLVSISLHIFRWQWFALYAGLPVASAWLLGRQTGRPASRTQPTPTKTSAS